MLKSAAGLRVVYSSADVGGDWVTSMAGEGTSSCSHILQYPQVPTIRAGRNSWCHSTMGRCHLRASRNLENGPFALLRMSVPGGIS